LKVQETLVLYARYVNLNSTWKNFVTKIK